MPEFDATRIEHRVIDGPPADAYEAAVHADFLDVVLRSMIVRGLFALRATAERVAATARRSPVVSPPEPPFLRLAEMPEHGDWVRLGADPPNEFAFGVIGRFWAGETTWAQIDFLMVPALYWGVQRVLRRVLTDEEQAPRAEVLADTLVRFLTAPNAGWRAR